MNKKTIKRELKLHAVILGFLGMVFIIAFIRTIPESFAIIILLALFAGIIYYMLRIIARQLFKDWIEK